MHIKSHERDIHTMSSLRVIKDTRDQLVSLDTMVRTESKVLAVPTESTDATELTDLPELLVILEAMDPVACRVRPESKVLAERLERAVLTPRETRETVEISDPTAPMD